MAFVRFWDHYQILHLILNEFKQICEFKFRLKIGVPTVDFQHANARWVYAESGLD